MAEHVQDRAESIQDIAEEGYLLSFGKMAAPANSYDPPGGYVEVGQANVFPTDWNGDFSNDVLVDDRFYLVADEVDVRACTHLRELDGDLYNICAVESFKFDGVTNLFYIIQTRGEKLGALDT